jgi:hypothetical protein
LTDRLGVFDFLKTGESVTLHKDHGISIVDQQGTFHKQYMKSIRTEASGGRGFSSGRFNSDESGEFAL